MLLNGSLSNFLIKGVLESALFDTTTACLLTFESYATDIRHSSLDLVLITSLGENFPPSFDSIACVGTKMAVQFYLHFVRAA